MREKDKFDYYMSLADGFFLYEVYAYVEEKARVRYAGDKQHAYQFVSNLLGDIRKTILHVGRTLAEEYAIEQNKENRLPEYDILSNLYEKYVDFALFRFINNRVSIQESTVVTVVGAMLAELPFIYIDGFEGNDENFREEFLADRMSGYERFLEDYLSKDSDVVDN